MGDIPNTGCTTRSIRQSLPGLARWPNDHVRATMTRNKWSTHGGFLTDGKHNPRFIC
jgi:hypothetical protein